MAKAWGALATFVMGFSFLFSTKPQDWTPSILATGALLFLFAVFVGMLIEENS